ncbi:class F sortase [Streptomyces sp. B6B3]|uniref:class F sortase n=1 Tax=Streptomyces sp. B6B3 TaxID=3153570 RepID=UPI00325E8AF4
MRSGRLASCAVWTLLLFVLWTWGCRLTDGGPFGGAGTGTTAEGAPAVARAAPLSGDPAPTLLEIDAIGVRAAIVPRGLDAAGGVAPPPLDTPDAVGWYAAGPTPGAAGAAVLVGHLDTATDPAVFHDLGSVEPGTRARITREDGSTAEFTVSDTEVVEHADFDAHRVYGPHEDGAAELRLITCGGDYDHETGGYSANVVVSARLTGTG